MQLEDCFHNCLKKKSTLVKNHQIEAYSDEELLESFLQGRDNLYLGKLLERYVRFVFVICMKYLKDKQLARDMSMQVFEKVIHDVHRFEIRNFKAWLHVVTKNTCLMHLRTGKKFAECGFENENELDLLVENAGTFHHDEGAENEQRLVELEQAIETLESGQKICVELFYLKEKSYKEVAAATGYSLNQVKSYIQNGKRNLKNWLTSNGFVILAVFIDLYWK